MSQFWNEAELKRPSFQTVEVPKANFIINLHHVLTKCLQNDHGENKEFSYTAALLSRLIARRKNSFRRMIGFRALLKLNSALARLLRVDLQRDLEAFIGVLPDMVFGKKEIAALPTQNCVDFILLRLLTVYEIHQRIQDCIVDAAKYFAELMRANNFLDINVVLISVLAKLRSLNMILANRFINVYNNLVGFRELFPMGKQNTSFATECEMPKQLKLFELPQSTEKTLVRIDVLPTKQIMLASKNKNLRKGADIGTEVERRNQSSKPQKSQQIFSIDKLKNVDDIKRFIASETNERKQHFDQCITRKIQNQTWMGAQTIFERKVQKGDEKKAVSVFRKLLSSNI